MDVFKLQKDLIDSYSNYVQSFINIADPGINDIVKSELREGLLWPDPLVQLNPSFEAGKTIDELVTEGILHKECANIFRKGADTYLPLYEAKMVHHFDHRFGTYEGQTEEQIRKGQAREFTPEEHADPNKVVLPRYWVPKHEVDERLEGRWDRQWLIGWRRISPTTNERTMIMSIIPNYGVGDSLFLIMSAQFDIMYKIYANACSFCFDYLIRQKIGGSNINFFLLRQSCFVDVMHKNIIAFNHYKIILKIILDITLELIYTSYEIMQFALDNGYDGPPFIWNDERRFLLRCELDAIYFHLYEIARDDVDYIMETFPIVLRKDEAKFGEYRTKVVILEVYDRIAESIRTGEPYQTLLDPPPADPSLAHPPRANDS